MALAAVSTTRSESDEPDAIALGRPRRRDCRRRPGDRRTWGGRKRTRGKRLEARRDRDHQFVDDRRQGLVVADRKAAQALRPGSEPAIELAGGRLAGDDEEIRPQQLVGDLAAGIVGRGGGGALEDQIELLAWRRGAEVERDLAVGALPAAAAIGQRLAFRQHGLRHAEPDPRPFVGDDPEARRAAGRLALLRQRPSLRRREQAVGRALAGLEGVDRPECQRAVAAAGSAVEVSGPDQVGLDRLALGLGQALEGRLGGGELRVGGRGLGRRRARQAQSHSEETKGPQPGKPDRQRHRPFPLAPEARHSATDRAALQL